MEITIILGAILRIGILLTLYITQLLNNKFYSIIKVSKLTNKVSGKALEASHLQVINRLK